MKKNTPFLFLLLFAQMLIAQSQSERSVVVFEPHQLNQIQTIKADGQKLFKGACLAEIPLQNIHPFLAYSIVWHTHEWAEESTMEAQFRQPNSATIMQPVLKESHAHPREGQHISQLYFTEKNVQKVRLAFSNTALVERIEIHFYNPGKTDETPTAVSDGGNRFACPCPQPDYLDRMGWCPDGSCPADASPAFTMVTHLIVHHSAGSNTSSDWSATVRSIYDFHVFTNGWADIGYNWLIDPNGVIYQGRGDNIRGAHFCGTNTGTMGVCVMGDYTDVLPMPDAISSLQDLLAWKTCDVELVADGTAFHSSSGLDLMHISGHRDGCATQCPGNTFYPTLSAVRDSVKWMIDTECNGLSIAAPTNLQAFFGANNNIEVTWEDNADNEEGYQLERSLNNNNNFAVIAELPANTTSYEDSANPDNQYHYRIKATVGDAYSDFSNEAIYFPPLNDVYAIDEKTVQLFPNPTNGWMNVKINNDFLGDMSLSVFNVIGQVVIPETVFEKQHSEEQIEVDLSEMEAGVYFLKIRQNGQEGLRRVVKY